MEYSPLKHNLHDPDEETAVLIERDHIRGPDSAPITLVEYGDYQCAQCREVYLEIEKLLQLMGDKLRFVFRQYPFSRLHPQADLAAEAAEAAGAQGRFWEMHDLLFQHQDALLERHLLRYAERIGLDIRRFRRELKERVYRDRVLRDFRSGVLRLVFSTPTVFINDVRYTGAPTVEGLHDAVSRAEAQTSGAERAG